MGTVRSIHSDKTTPTHHNHGAMIHSALHHKRIGTIQVKECKSELMLADQNTKPISSPTLNTKIDRIIGGQYYLPENLEHHTILFKAAE
eukprot:12756251-Ditylum_brightwellii.AAC.1